MDYNWIEKLKNKHSVVRHLEANNRKLPMTEKLKFIMMKKVLMTYHLQRILIEKCP